MFRKRNVFFIPRKRLWNTERATPVIEREKEREREYVCVCVSEREREKDVDCSNSTQNPKETLCGIPKRNKDTRFPLSIDS